MFHQLKLKEIFNFFEAALKNNLKLNTERKNHKSIKQNINISRSEFLPSISLSSNQEAFSLQTRLIKVAQI